MKSNRSDGPSVMQRDDNNDIEIFMSHPSIKMDSPMKVRDLNSLEVMS